MYFSINDDTLSNRLVDDLEKMERTLTGLAEEEEDDDDRHKSTELSSVIQNTHMDLLMTTKDEEFFQQNLPLKLMFPNNPMRSQCSTPKLEVVANAPRQQTATPQKTTPIVVKDDNPTTIAPAIDILPLTTILQKIENKKPKKAVTIVENKENVPKAEEATIAKIPARPTNLRKSLMKPRTTDAAGPAIPAKRPTLLRKSMMPNAPPTSSTATVTAIAKGEFNLFDS